MDFYIFLSPIIILSGVVIGVFLSKKKKLTRPILIICLILIFLYLFPTRDYLIIFLASFVPFSIFVFDSWVGFSNIIFFIIAYENIQNKRSKKAVFVFTLFLIAYFLVNSFLFLIPSNENELKTLIDKNGTCIQSTGYTCGAASMVTFLKLYNVNSTEYEMAKISYTKTGIGVDDLGIYYALKKKLEGSLFKLKIKKASIEGLKEINQPVIVSKKYSYLIDHVIVILSYENNQFKVADPLIGITNIQESDLEKEWRKIIIYIDETN